MSSTLTHDIKAPPLNAKRKGVRNSPLGKKKEGKKEKKSEEVEIEQRVGLAAFFLAFELNERMNE